MLKLSYCIYLSKPNIFNTQIPRRNASENGHSLVACSNTSDSRPSSRCSSLQRKYQADPNIHRKFSFRFLRKNDTCKTIADRESTDRDALLRRLLFSAALRAEVANWSVRAYLIVDYQALYYVLRTEGQD
jgi:hypothetical protein